MSTPASEILAIMRSFYEMGYFHGRADASDGRPYDARLPHERPDDAAISPPSSDPSSEPTRTDLAEPHPP